MLFKLLTIAEIPDQVREANCYQGKDWWLQKAVMSGITKVDLYFDDDVRHTWNLSDGKWVRSVAPA